MVLALSNAPRLMLLKVTRRLEERCMAAGDKCFSNECPSSGTFNYSFVSRTLPKYSSSRVCFSLLIARYNLFVSSPRQSPSIRKRNRCVLNEKVVSLINICGSQSRRADLRGT